LSGTDAGYGFAAGVVVGPVVAMGIVVALGRWLSKGRHAKDQIKGSSRSTPLPRNLQNREVPCPRNPPP